MDVDADRPTETPANRLAAIVPDGFHVRAVDGMLWYSADDGRLGAKDGSPFVTLR